MFCSNDCLLYTLVGSAVVVDKETRVKHTIVKLLIFIILQKWTMSANYNSGLSQHLSTLSVDN